MYFDPLMICFPFIYIKSNNCEQLNLFYLNIFFNYFPKTILFHLIHTVILEIISQNKLYLFTCFFNFQLLFKMQFL